MVTHKILTTDEQIADALRPSKSSGEDSRLIGYQLANVEGENSLILRMNDGSKHVIPISEIEGLSKRSDEEILQGQISEDGLVLTWTPFDLDLYVPSLVEGVYGTKRWMSSLGRVGGRVRSEAKRRAAQANGRKGGRPRKRATLDLDLSASEEDLENPVPLNRHSRLITVGRYRHTRAVFALLFDLDPAATARPLPRMA